MLREQVFFLLWFPFQAVISWNFFRTQRILLLEIFSIASSKNCFCFYILDTFSFTPESFLLLLLFSFCAFGATHFNCVIPLLFYCVWFRERKETLSVELNILKLLEVNALLFILQAHRELLSKIHIKIEKWMISSIKSKVGWKKWVGFKWWFLWR